MVEDHFRYLHHPDRTAAARLAPAVAAAALDQDLEDYVDFPVRLPPLPASRLTGARRCFLLGRRAALAFYATPAGPTSYFILPTDGIAPPGGACPGLSGMACATSRGFHLVSWESGGLLHTLVGTGEAPLAALARAARSAP